jgi:radical SAM protein with 4Fe4S-binding SPASM domain
VDALDRMKRGVRMLIDGGFGVQTFVVLHRLNYRELPQIVTFAKSLGARSIRISIPVACGRSAVHPEETALEPEQLREALEITLQVEEENPGFLAGRWIPDTHFYRDLKEGRSSRTEIKSDGMFRECGAARQQITIAPDGTVLPCELVCTCRAGNLREQSFLDIWHNSPVLKSVRECRGMPLDQVHGCQGCPWHLSCRGPCPADGYGVTGIWPSTRPTCMTRSIGRLFGYEAETPSASESIGSGMIK